MKIMDSAEFDKVNVFGKGTENTAYAKYFIGMSYLNPLTPKSGMGFANVTFEPGCRNNWHVIMPAEEAARFLSAPPARDGIRKKASRQ